ncbi:hypothetical protein L1987_20797 [Smallanthus sonchifolius]|uniref:Uncharacterized protein n=1 Tax=Smallanthus sonchifolius TaxID=185202 RepID=A0ACB9IUI5_9ASTR|nr:hypothetical protein L1987_20797 [Smallanthus sonchifolius]
MVHTAMTVDKHAIEDVARYVGEASVDCVRTKYESKGKEVAAIMKDTLPTSLKDAIKQVEKEKNEARGRGGEARGRDRRVRDNRNDDSDDELMYECNYKSFRGCDPLTFDSRKDAIAAYYWIDRMSMVIHGPLPSKNPKKWTSSNKRKNDGW